VRKRLSRARQSLHQDLIARLGDFARSSAPSAAFTAIVVGSLAFSQSAAAAGFAGAAGAFAGQGLGKMSAALGALGKGAGKLLIGSSGAFGRNAPRLMLGVAGGIVFALIAGIASVLFGVRKHWITAIDEQEKRELAWFAAVGILTVFVFTALMTAAIFVESVYLPTLSFLGLMGAIGAMNLTWLPRILARRHAREHTTDPVRAAKERIAEKRMAWAGMLIGMVLGGSGLMLGLASTGAL
jgi:hypothetical protein